MSDTHPSTAPRRRVQFTVRTLFIAAVLVSLFGAAAHLPGEPAKAIAVTFLASLTFAGLYWTFGGTGPLVALPVGTAVAGTLLVLTRPFVDFGRHEGIWVVLPLGFVWGIVFSVIVVLSRVLRHLTKWWNGWLKRGSREELPFDRDATLALPPLAYAKYVLFTRLLLAVFVLSAALVLVQYRSDVVAIPLVISAYLDGPLIPLFLKIYDPLGTGRYGIDVIGFILITSVVACPLHAGTSWIVGFIVARIDRRLMAPVEPNCRAPGEFDLPTAQR